VGAAHKECILAPEGPWGGFSLGPKGCPPLGFYFPQTRKGKPQTPAHTGAGRPGFSQNPSVNLMGLSPPQKERGCLRPRELGEILFLWVLEFPGEGFGGRLFERRGESPLKTLGKEIVVGIPFTPELFL